MEATLMGWHNYSLMESYKSKTLVKYPFYLILHYAVHLCMYKMYVILVDLNFSALCPNHQYLENSVTAKNKCFTVTTWPTQSECSLRQCISKYLVF